NCMTVSGMRGREFKAKQTRLVMYLKNLDLCYLDAWGCSEIVELLLQLVQRQGFYNDNSSSNSGLNASYHLQGSSGGGGAGGSGAHFKGISLQNLQSISEGLMEFYTKFQAAFNMARQRGSSASGNNTDATIAAGCCYAHYQFSPKFIMKTLANLKYYPENAFNEALYCELVSMFKDRLANQDDAEKFETILRHSLRKIGNKE
ncbi:hypothetical protein DOY81_013061, partial [Sarcophaga bullata]